MQCLLKLNISKMHVTPSAKIDVFPILVVTQKIQQTILLAILNAHQLENENKIIEY